MTESWVNTDEFIVLDGTAQKRKASNEIPINLLGLPDAALAMNSKKNYRTFRSYGGTRCGN